MCTGRYINPFTDFSPMTEYLSEAEVSKLSLDESRAYQLSLKRMRDSQNIVNTAREEGIKEGIKEGIQKRNIEIVKGGLKMGFSIEQIAALTNLKPE